jgi:hypothetical protein
MPKRPSGQNPKNRLRNLLGTFDGGKFILALWDWEGGVVGKLLILLLAVAAGIIYFHYANSPPSQTISFTGNSNSISGPLTMGNSNTVNNAPTIIGITNSPGAKVIVGLSDESMELIRKQAIEDMESKEKKFKSYLTNFFPGGYAIFSATKGEQIIPLDRKSDQNMFEVDWTPCSVKLLPDRLEIVSPNVRFNGPGFTNMKFGSGSTHFPRPIVLDAEVILADVGENEKKHSFLGMWILATNEDAVTIIIGIHPVTNH